MFCFWGHQVYGMMFKPPNIEAGVKYPTMLFLYGGPHVQVSQARKIAMVSNLLIPHSLGNFIFLW